MGAPEPGSDNEPLDGWDPRFARPDGRAPGPTSRRLVRSRGPGASPEDPRVRLAGIGVRVVFAAGLLAIALVFFTGLQPGPQVSILGPEPDVRRAVAERPKRTCFNDNNPCAWITTVGEDLVAFNTNGPLTQEYGRAGIAWCASSGWFGSNATGSRFDQHGVVAGGPAPRGLDRFRVRVDADRRVVVDFTQLTTGVQVGQAPAPQPPAGPHCETIPFDRDADLVLPASSRTSDTNASQASHDRS